MGSATASARGPRGTAPLTELRGRARRRRSGDDRARGLHPGGIGVRIGTRRRLHRGLSQSQRPVQATAARRVGSAGPLQRSLRRPSRPMAPVGPSTIETGAWCCRRLGGSACSHGAARAPLPRCLLRDPRPRPCFGRPGGGLALAGAAGGRFRPLRRRRSLHAVKRTALALGGRSLGGLAAAAWRRGDRHRRPDQPRADVVRAAGGHAGRPLRPLGDGGRDRLPARGSF